MGGGYEGLPPISESPLVSSGATSAWPSEGVGSSGAGVLMVLSGAAGSIGALSGTGAGAGAGVEGTATGATAGRGFGAGFLAGAFFATFFGAGFATFFAAFFFAGLAERADFATIFFATAFFFLGAAFFGFAAIFLALPFDFFLCLAMDYEPRTELKRIVLGTARSRNLRSKRLSLRPMCASIIAEHGCSKTQM